jgi:integrase
MSELLSMVDDYLKIRTSLGFKLERAHRLLPEFVHFVERHGSPYITTELSLRWACTPSSASRYWWSRRLAMVRLFAQHARAFDPRTEIPSADFMPYRHTRSTPYIYSDGDIAALLTAADTIRSSFRALTYRTLLSLLVVTGMRVGEVIALERSDIDWTEATLTIRQGKFGKTREVPLHVTTKRALWEYALERDRVIRPLNKPCFFVSQHGNGLIYKNVHFIFSRLRREAGLDVRRPCPRIHDLRHSFATRTLLSWYRDGLDVQARLSLLATYLGHVSVNSTYWYLTAIPELLHLAGSRLERFREERT